MNGMTDMILINDYLFKPKKYNILVLGSNGMLGHELHQRLLNLSICKESNIGTVIGMDKDNIDITQRDALGNFFMKSIHFDYCINCAAYTNTNAAQTTAEGRVLDYKLNALAPKYIAESCKFWKTKLIHVSTDYVFSEKSEAYVHNVEDGHTPFHPHSEPFPCNVYGYDKLIGEMNINEIFGENSKDYCIMRVSWLYGMYNNKSFVHKFIANVVKAAKEGKNEIEMTSNECSVPTSCSYAIDCIIDAISEKLYGIYHAVPVCEDTTTDHKGVSRLEFAEKILQFLKDGKYNASDEDYIDFSNISLVSVKRSSYWPEFSVMKSSASWSKSWDEILNEFLSKNAEDILKWAEYQNSK